MADHPEIKAWADELDGLLQKAATARAAGDTAKIVAIQKELRKFKEDSPDYADALDMQASLAIFDLDLADSETAAANLKERGAEVYRLTKLISGISDEARSNADILSGTLAIQAIDAATSAISSFKKLRDELSVANADEKAIAGEIEKAMTAVQKVRTKLEKP